MNIAAKLSFVSSTAILVFLVSSCSLGSVWDAENYFDGAKCDLTGGPKCFEGYDCMVNKCVKHNSVRLGETCLGDNVCMPELVCSIVSQVGTSGGGGYVCKQGCSKFWDDDTVCDSTTYCKPFIDTTTGLYQEKNACYEGECSISNAEYAENKPGKKCNSSSQDCAVFKTGVGACFTTCSYWFKNGEYTDSIVTSGKICHPVGLLNPIMAEMPAGSGVEGEPCNILNNPCSAGYVCIKGFGTSDVCHKLCQTNADGQQEGCIDDGVCNEPSGNGTQPYKFCSLGMGK